MKNVKSQNYVEDSEEEDCEMNEDFGCGQTLSIERK